VNTSYGLVDQRQSWTAHLLEQLVKITATRLVEGSEPAWRELVVGGGAGLQVALVARSALVVAMIVRHTYDDLRKTQAELLQQRRRLLPFVDQGAPVHIAVRGHVEVVSQWHAVLQLNLAGQDDGTNSAAWTWRQQMRTSSWLALGAGKRQHR
jgi:hypothetical protein